MRPASPLQRQVGANRRVCPEHFAGVSDAVEAAEA